MQINILITIFSLIYVILLYLGYIRVLKLHAYSCEHFSKSYLKTPRTESKGKVLVSIATEKSDFSAIKSTVNSILDQTVHGDQIILSLPKESKVTIPSYLKDSNILIVHRLCTDYKNLTCLLSPLLREKDGDAKIILLSDNQIYGEDFVETLVDASEKSPDSVVFVSGYNANASIKAGEKVSTPYSNDVIDLNGGVLIKPKFFDEDIFNLEEQPTGIENNADVFLSSYLHKKGVNFLEINYNENFRKVKELLPGSDKVIGYYAALFPSFN